MAGEINFFIHDHDWQAFISRFALDEETLAETWRPQYVSVRAEPWG